jgi:hypothetical protein
MDGMTMETTDYSNGLSSAPAEDETNEVDQDEAEAEAEIVRTAKERYKLGVDATAAWREAALEDQEFLAGEQWSDQDRGARQAQGRPCLTVNRLPQFVRQVTNEQRQSKPSITVNPVDGQSDIQTAEVLQGVIRNIEYTSNADAAYAAGGQSAAVTGLGYWDVCAEYEDERSFDQRLTIRRIKNPMSVVMDPGAKEQAGDDARWVINSSDMSKAEWEAAFPGKEMPVGGGSWDGRGDKEADWVGKGGIRIYEYRYITEEEDTLIDVSQVLQMDPAFAATLKQAGVEIQTGAVLESELGAELAAHLKSLNLETRPTTKRKACWVKIAGDEIVERGELAGRYLQVVRVVGSEQDVNGEAIYEGIVRHAKDTQKMLNFYVSAEAEAIALTPKAPWIMAEGQDEGHETEWEVANQRAHSRLIYKPTTVAGQPAPRPERVMAEANIQAVSQARMQTADDLKAVTGIYDAQLGARSNEQSGRAILARQNQGQTANFHFQDNLAMAIRYTGRILIDLIPKIYSGPRVLRILGDDGKHEMVPVNGADGTFKGEPALQNGQPVIDLNAGRYDVAVSMGSSYLSRRQEAVAQLLELIKVDPQIAPIIADILVRAMDIPDGNAIADRLMKMLPPQIRPPDENQPPAQMLAGQLQSMSQQHEQLVQTVHTLQDQLDSKAADNASRERIAQMQAVTELIKTDATLSSKEALTKLNHFVSLFSQHLEATAAEQQAPAPQGAPQESMPNG